MTEDAEMKWPASLAILLGFVLLSFSAAAIGGFATAEAVRSWYPGLDKPPWTPPNWAFGPVWTVLYTCMAVAIWDVVRRGWSQATTALGLFGIQWVLNVAWSPLFFAAQRVGMALIVISALWVAIVACIAVYWPRSKLGAGLMVPYLAWISIAWSLNAWILAYNDVSF